MILRKVLTVFVVFFSTTSTYAQVEKIDFIYELVWKSDSLKLDKIKKEDMILQVKGEESCFQSMLKHDFENNMGDFESAVKSHKGVTTEMAQKINPTFDYRIFKASHTLKVEERIMRKPYTYEMDFDPGQWQIQAEQDSVAGFWSQKATVEHNGRSYIAWFTTEIPVADGPYIFYGLPGLIVKLQDTQDHYIFTLKEVSKTASIWPPLTKNAISATFGEISKIKRTLRQDPMTDPLKAGFFGDPKDIETVRRLAQADNNPLERNQ